jgi:hypothetical protein
VTLDAEDGYCLLSTYSELICSCPELFGEGEECRGGGKGEQGEEGKRKEGKRGSMRYNVSLVRLLGLANAVAGVVEVEGLVIVLGAA